MNLVAEDSTRFLPNSSGGHESKTGLMTLKGDSPLGLFQKERLPIFRAHGCVTGLCFHYHLSSGSPAPFCPSQGPLCVEWA